MHGNQPWAKNANVLIVSIARKTFAANQKENPYAKHDLGMATANLLSQANAMEIYTHPMAGYDKAALIEKIGLSPDQEPVCVIAAGFLAPADSLEEPFKTRELTERSRKPLSEFVIGI